ncbi:beta-lactamase regulating signal transducer with metallopeptidase domain [Lewinella marina]|uniref:Peptidase M56 domain-containing protein n=1 Tax=Neolewinella marina TaxID=438751 RepID=A0A2G0CKB0_9BACT|nr:M56 family metallopeptidase [Neolewinella marina]NJB84391.1 beta-lactamase regulating signal transducer with metallopeptidase domain [Neolewinella marina]PHL00414.1 hypothetical protein CGL56_05105 [Neolewinella marina]
MLDPLLGTAGLYAAGMTILHSFWQASLLALSLWLFARWAGSTAHSRYRLGCALLLGQVVVSVFTFLQYYEPAGAPVAGPSAAYFLASVPEVVARPDYFWSADFWMSALVVSWVVSMLAGTLRLGWSYGQLRQLAATAEPVNETGLYAVLYEKVRQLADRLGYSGALRLGISDRISGPMLVGHLKPVLLFPLALVNDLTTEEAESVILHELAHLRRYDHLLHPLQCLVEIIYYYHPAIHWIGERIREERENCCDDLVLLHGPGRLPYARALLYFSEHPPAATAALSLTNGGGLLARVRRFIDHQEIKYTMNSRLLLLPLLALLTLVATAAYVPDGETVTVESTLPFPVTEPALAAPDTLPPGNHQVTKISNGKTTRLRVEDGKIKELELEGRSVPPEEFPAHEETAEELLGMKDHQNHFRVGPLHYYGPGDSLHGFKALARIGDLDYDNFNFDFEALGAHMDSISGELARVYHLDMEDGEGMFRMKGFKMDSFKMPSFPEMPMFHPYRRELDDLDLEELEQRERELRDALRELENRRKKLSEEGDDRRGAIDWVPEGQLERTIAHRKAMARQAREQYLAEGRRMREESRAPLVDCPEMMAVALAEELPREIEVERVVRRLDEQSRMIGRTAETIRSISVVRGVCPG